MALEEALLKRRVEEIEAGLQSSSSNETAAIRIARLTLWVKERAARSHSTGPLGSHALNSRFQCLSSGTLYPFDQV